MIAFFFTVIGMAVVIFVIAAACDSYGQRGRTTYARERDAAKHRHPAGKRRRHGEDVWEAAGVERAPETRQMRALPPVPASR